MRILFIGDVFGNTGRRILAERLRTLRPELGVDLCIANGENVAGGKGITAAIARKMHKYGIEVITGGNHSFANPDGNSALEKDTMLLRPLNYPEGNIGRGQTVYTLPDGRAVAVINLQGRTFFREKLECPFRLGARAVEQALEKTPIVIVDFHAEATSEKRALFFHLDGKASAVLGTHTHIQTADEAVSSRGTAYISDTGMTGPHDSDIGMKPEPVIRHFLLQTWVRYEPAEGGPMLNAVVIDIDDNSGRARNIFRIRESITFSQAADVDGEQAGHE